MGFFHPRFTFVLSLSLVPLATASSACACAVEVADWPRPPVSPLDSASGGVDDAGDAGGATISERSDATTECPDLAGSWSGSLDGAISAGLVKYPVTGAIWIVLKAAGAGDFSIDKGEMTCQAKSLPSLKASQQLTGEVRCGVLDLTQQTDLLGVKAKGTVRCSFEPGGCKGTWTGEALDGSGTRGSGTFELRRN